MWESLTNVTLGFLTATVVNAYWFETSYTMSIRASCILFAVSFIRLQLVRGVFDRHATNSKATEGNAK